MEKSSKKQVSAKRKLNQFITSLYSYKSNAMMRKKADLIEIMIEK